MQMLGTGIFSFRTWIQCLGHPSTKPYPEEDFYRHLCRLLGVETPELMSANLDTLCRFVTSELFRKVSAPWHRRQARRKSSGATRWLHVPVPLIKKAQHELCRQISRRLPGHPCSTAFSAHRSPALHARFHAGARAAVVVDIQDFFGSVRWKHALRSLFRTSPYWAGLQGALTPPFAQWSRQGLALLKEITFVIDSPGSIEFLPQGAPSSPVIANSVGALLDQMIETSETFQNNSGWSYSRYADDLVISSRNDAPDFHLSAEKLIINSIRSFDWDISPSKTRHWRIGRGGQLVLCGAVVPEAQEAKVQLPRDVRRRVRAACHVLSRDADDPKIVRAAHGLLAYAYSISSDLRLLGYLPNEVRKTLTAIAQSLPGSSAMTMEAFIEGWRSGDPMTPYRIAEGDPAPSTG